ncbi:MAG TPA: hypothetical protein VKU41_12520, partial [Polyangiaceae bacterium]|nr:hypothetical protein [Polyangiaceae bacterium]
TAVGMAPAIPWLVYLVRDRPRPNPSPWWLRFRLEFYQYFFSDPTAMTTPYVIGDDALPAMRYPLVAGRGTYLVGAAFACLAVASAVIGARALRHAWARRSDLSALLLGDRTETSILVGAALVGMGAMMTLPSISIYRHYMLAAFPLPYVWAARAALRDRGGRALLAVLFAGGLVVSTGTLCFVADHDGAREFGKDWAAQVRDHSSTADAKLFRQGVP